MSEEAETRKSRFTEKQIVLPLKEVEGGRKVKDVCRKLGISEATYYQWKSKYGGMEAGNVRRLKELEDEKSRLKRMPPVLELPAPGIAYRVGSETPVSRCTSATVRALGGIIFSTTLALNSSLYRGIPSALSAPSRGRVAGRRCRRPAPSRAKFTASNPADFYADRGGPAHAGAFKNPGPGTVSQGPWDRRTHTFVQR